MILPKAMTAHNLYCVLFVVGASLRVAADLLVESLILPDLKALAHVVCQQLDKVASPLPRCFLELLPEQ